MSRVRPTPVEVWFEGRWHRATLRTCEVSPDGSTCSGVVSWNAPDYARTARFSASEMRTISGEPGCPADHEDHTCAGSCRAASAAEQQHPSGRAGAEGDRLWR